MTNAAENAPSLRLEPGEERMLVDRMVRRRDHSAFLAVYDRYSRLIFNLARKILRDDAEADEVLQDVFWQFWKTANQIDLRKGNLSSWLVTMARNRSIDRLRSRMRRNETFEEGILDAELNKPSEERPESYAEKISIQKALSSLSESQRKAIEFAYFWGMSHNEIAEKLGEPLGTVKTRIRSALLELRELLGATLRGTAASE